MAVKHEAKMSADLPMRMAPDAKREKPGRPDLGLVDYRYLHRHTWVDRVLRMVSGGTLKVCCAIPPEWRAHMTANVLRPVEQMHGQESPRLEWEKPPKYRDDWMQAKAYAIAAGVAHGDLETLHLRGHAVGELMTFTFGGSGETGDQDRAERW
jgi:hypothetical protein